MKEAYSADELPAAQRKAKVTMAFNALGVLKNEGGERGDAGRRARGKGRETSNRPDAENERGRDGSRRRAEDRAGEISGEAVARPAVCTAEVLERFETWAETDSCPVAVLRRCRTAAPLLVQAAPQACATAFAASSVFHTGQAQCHRADSSCIETSQWEVVWKVSLMEKAFSEERAGSYSGLE